MGRKLLLRTTFEYRLISGSVYKEVQLFMERRDVRVGRAKRCTNPLSEIV